MLKPKQFTIVLSTRSGEKLGAIGDAYDVTIKRSFNAPDEISFSVPKENNSEPTPLWNSIVDFKLVWVKEIDEWFEIYVEIDDNGSTIKNVTGTSLAEAELSQTNVYSTEINTEDDIAREDYVPTVLYDADNANRSLLHRILEKAPHYRIRSVDSHLANIQRMFSFDSKTIYDCLNEVSEEIGCLFVFGNDSDDNGLPARTISVYDLQQRCADCGTRGEFTEECPNCGGENIIQGYGEDTTVFVSVDNLSDDIKYTTDNNSVKNCFKLVAGDDLMTATIRNCLPSGDGYLWYVPEAIRSDMSKELSARLLDYDEEYREYNEQRQFVVDTESYNNLVAKYHPDDIQKVFSGGQSGDEGVYLNGFANVTAAYFSAIGFYYYLKSGMMPSIEISTVTAASQLNDIKNNLSYIAIQSGGNQTSSTTMEVAIKNAAKIYFYSSKYKITVSTNSWSYPNWTGTISLENNNDASDIASDTFSIALRSDEYSYISQQLSKRTSDLSADDYSASALFARDYDDFVSSLKLFAVDHLSSLYDICQGCISILIEQGYGDQSSSSYETMYVPWRNKLSAIKQALDERSAEVDVVSYVEDQILGIINTVHDALDFEDYLGQDLFREFAAYRRDDTYTNDNYVSTGLSDAELVGNALDFITAANSEIYKSANLQHSISASMSNILEIEEFAPVADHFAVGNWIRVCVDNSVFRLRLTQYVLKDSDGDIDVEFSDVTSSGSDLRSILSKSANMATSYGAVTRQAKAGKTANDEINQWVANGLDATKTKIINSADYQDLVIDNSGLTARRYNPITEDYSDEQVKMTNSTLAFTSDGWESVKTALGKYYGGDGDTYYGLIAETIVGKIIAGNSLSIEASDENGKTTFRVDGTGVFINVSNSGLSIDGQSVDAKIEVAKGEILQEISRSEEEGGVDYLYVQSLIDQKADEILTSVSESYSTIDDVMKRIDDASSETSANITKSVENAQSIIFTALEEYSKTSDFESLKSSVSSQLSVMSNGITLNVQNLTTRLEELQGDIRSQSELVSKVFRFASDGFYIGDPSSDIQLKQSNDRVSFIDNGLEIAYWANKEFHAETIVADSALKVIPFAWTTRTASDGSKHLSLKVGA